MWQKMSVLESGSAEAEPVTGTAQALRGASTTSQRGRAGHARPGHTGMGTGLGHRPPGPPLEPGSQRVGNGPWGHSHTGGAVPATAVTRERAGPGHEGAADRGKGLGHSRAAGARTRSGRQYIRVTKKGTENRTASVGDVGELEKSQRRETGMSGRGASLGGQTKARPGQLRKEGLEGGVIKGLQNTTRNSEEKGNRSLALAVWRQTSSSGHSRERAGREFGTTTGPFFCTQREFKRGTRGTRCGGH